MNFYIGEKKNEKKSFYEPRLAGGNFILFVRAG